MSKEYFANVSKIAHVVNTGIISKDMFLELIHGDFKGLAINSGLIFGGMAFDKASGYFLAKGEVLVLEEGVAVKFIGNTMRMAVLFVKRGTSAFIIYDLVEQVEAYKRDGNEEALSWYSGG